MIGINSQISCLMVRGGVPLHDFDACVIVNTSSAFTVTFQVKNDINYSDSDDFILTCQNVRMPNLDIITSLPTIALMKNDGVSFILLASTIKMPLMHTLVERLDASVTRDSFNTVGSVSSMTLTFNSDDPTSGTNFFLVRFCKDYLPHLF